MLNNITIMGRLTEDPVIRATADGIPVASFSIACERPKRSGAEKVTDFFQVTAWRNTATFIEKYFKKGNAVVIIGRLQQDSYTNKDGKKVSRVLINAQNVEFAAYEKAESQAGGGSEGWEPVPDDVADAELPFH